jgi:hypothetical protein
MVEAELLSPCQQLSSDGSGTELAQVTVLLELASQLDDQLFETLWGGLCLASATSGTSPIDTIESLAMSMRNPSLHGGQARTELDSN